MKRAPLDYAVSLLLAPVICITTTLSIRQDLERDAARLGNSLDRVDYAQITPRCRETDYTGGA